MDSMTLKICSSFSKSMVPCCQWPTPPLCDEDNVRMRTDRTITTSQSWLLNASPKLGNFMVSALGGGEIKASRGAGQDSSDLKVNIQTAGHSRGCTAWKSRGKCDRGTAQGLIETCTIKDPSKCMFWYEVYPLAEQYPAVADPHRLLDVDMSQRMRKKPSDPFSLVLSVLSLCGLFFSFSFE